MKIYVTHSSDFDFKKELYEPLRSSVLNTEHEIILPHETDEFINSKEVINEVDLVLAEVSYPSTGQGIELGWAENAGTKVVCMFRKDHKYSGSLKVVSDIFIGYEDEKDLIEKIKSIIK